MAYIGTLYDGWKKLSCGIEVLFRKGVPMEFSGKVFDTKEPYKHDLLNELSSMGFSGVDIDYEFGVITFEDAINQELKRIGVHPSQHDNLRHIINVDVADDDVQVVLYDSKYKVEMTPTRALAALKTIPFLVDIEGFWNHLENYLRQINKIDWVERFKKAVRANDYADFGKKVGSDVIFKEKFSKVVEVVDKLDGYQKKLFVDFSHNDPEVMMQLASAL